MEKDGRSPHSNERKWQDPRSEENTPYHSFLCVVSEKEMDAEVTQKESISTRMKEASVLESPIRATELALLPLHSARGPSGRTRRIFFNIFY